MVYVTDPIGDLLARMRNAQAARRTQCSIPRSHLRERFCEVLKDQGWIESIEVKEEEIIVTFVEGKPRLELKRVSKPGRRVYSSAADLKPVLSGFGMAILTTSKGLMTDEEARKKGIGGEVLCTIS